MFQLEERQVGSAGNLIAAALETAGHFMQSSFIDTLANGLGGSLGALLLIVSAVSALTIIALGGDYKFGRWFVIGPPLFFALVFARVDSCGPKFIFGEREHEPEEVFAATKGLVDESTCESSPAHVSLVFSLWDKVTSGLVNEFTKVLRVNFQGSFAGRDLDFTKKVSTFIDLTHAEVVDPKLKQFINQVLLDKCHYYYTLVMELNDRSMGKPRGEIIQKNLEDYGNVENIDIKDAKYKGIREWLTGTDPAGGVAYEGVLTTDGKPTFDVSEDIFPTSHTGFVFSCKQIWALAVETAKNEAVANLAAAGAANKAGSGTTLTAQQQERIQLYEKAGYKASSSVDPATNEINVSTANDKKLITLINEMAVRSIIHEMANFNKSMRKDNLDQLPVNTPAGMRGSHEETTSFLRDILRREEFRGKGNYLRYMLGLPYVQGLLLYFLAIAYPFAAMALIVPGRHGTFLLWLGMWVWVKSWDFGFGVVMVIDDLLYKLLPHGLPLDGSTSDIYSAADTLKTVLAVDPTYSAHTYYNIIATCLGAVPVIMGVALKKGGGEIVSFAAHGLGDFAGHIEKAITGWEGAMRSQQLLSEVRARIDNAVANSVPEALARPEVAGNLMKSIAWGVLADTGSISDAANLLSNSVLKPGTDGFETILQSTAQQFPGRGYESVKSADEYLRKLVGDTIRGDNTGVIRRALGNVTETTLDKVGTEPLKKLAELESGRYRTLGIKYFEYSLKMAAYNESWSETNRRVVGLMASMGFYLHPISAPLPTGGDMVDIIRGNRVDYNQILNNVYLQGWKAAESPALQRQAMQETQYPN